MSKNDKSAIDELIAHFFNCFDNSNGRADLNQLNTLFINTGVVVKNSGEHPDIFTLTDFIGGRQAILDSGELMQFQEKELGEHTDIIGNIAQRLSLYKKTGIRGDNAFEQKGVKVFQLVRTTQGWRISSMAWDDERDGLLLPDIQQLRSKQQDICLL